MCADNILLTSNSIDKAKKNFGLVFQIYNNRLPLDFGFFEIW